MQEKENVIRILNKTKEAIAKKDSDYLKELSNQTIHTSSIHQDSDNIIIAVLVYSLSKMIERKKYHVYPGWDRFIKKIITHITNASSFLKKNDFDNYRNSIELIMSEISKLSEDIKKQIQDVFIKAKVNKASKIYEHGISMAKTAKLLGISLWELAEYAGQTQVSEVKYNKTIDEKLRIKNALDIFK